MADAVLRKDLFLIGRECQPRAWHASRRKTPPARTPADLQRAEEGIEIGRLAREWAPGGLLIGAREVAEGAEQTAMALADPRVETIYEATLVADGAVARADIIHRKSDGWELMEVKSSLNDRDELVDDLAYTVMMATRAGIAVTRASLVLLSRDFRRGMGVEHLFVSLDKTAEVGARIADFATNLTALVAVVQAEAPPTPTLIKACKECEYFSESCLGRGLAHPILELPRLQEKALAGLVSSGILEVSQVAAGHQLTPTQVPVRAAVASGKPQIDTVKLRSGINGVNWPAAYLDFETVKTALPLFDDIAPHEQLPTQFSIHFCTGLEDEPSHRAFLADHTRDDRRELAERLITELQGAATVVHFSPFEKTVVNGLAKRFPDLKDELEALTGRFFDLARLVQPDCVYYPAFRGSSSIKAVLPVLVPGMDYSTLAIADGDNAVAAFARMAMGRCTPSEVESTRRDLLAYCEQDTLAMVRLHRALADLAAP